MASESQLWIDQYLYEIPILTYDEENYREIIANFHYLILEKNVESHEEFIKYWAILIVTSPNLFDSLALAYNEDDTLFSRVYRDAIRFNRPIERIQLPHGQPKLIEASYFKNCNGKVNLKVDPNRGSYGSVIVDDYQVYKWYTNKSNIKQARAFFGAYCINLLRVFTRYRSSIAFQCNSRFIRECKRMTEIKEPKRVISFDETTASFLYFVFVKQAGVYRKIVRMVLDRFASYITKNHSLEPRGLTVDEWLSKEFKFFTYVIESPLQYYGLDIIKELRARSDEDLPYVTWSDLKIAIENTGEVNLILTMKKIIDLVNYIEACNFNEDLPDESGKSETCKFWTYSRLISPKFLKSLREEENLEFVSFVHGYNLRRAVGIDVIPSLRGIRRRQQYFQLGREIYHKMRQRNSELENEKQSPDYCEG